MEKYNYYPDESGPKHLDKTDDEYYNCGLPTVNVYDVTPLPSTIPNRFHGYSSSNPLEFD